MLRAIRKAIRRHWRANYLYVVAAILALPDVLDALSTVDFTVLLPPGVGTKVAFGIVLVKAVINPYIRLMPKPKSWEIRQYEDSPAHEEDADEREAGADEEPAPKPKRRAVRADEEST